MTRSFTSMDMLIHRLRSACLCAPAGLDLGGSAPVEIAVAILAELIQARYERQADVAGTQALTDAHLQARGG